MVVVYGIPIVITILGLSDCLADEHLRGCSSDIPFVHGIMRQRLHLDRKDPIIVDVREVCGAIDVKVNILF